MKKLALCTLFGLTILLFSCNNTEPEPEPGVLIGFHYNGQAYATPNLEIVLIGEVGQTGGGSTGIYEFDLIFFSEGLSSIGTPDGTRGFFLQAKIFSSSPNQIIFDQYSFSEETTAGVITEGLAILDFETPATFGQVIPFTSGQIAIESAGDQILAEYSFTTADGKTIDGFFIDAAANWIVSELD